jgi:hypothetical protein
LDSTWTVQQQGPRAVERDLEKPKRAGGAIQLEPIAAIEYFEAYLRSRAITTWEGAMTTRQHGLPESAAHVGFSAIVDRNFFYTRPLKSITIRMIKTIPPIPIPPAGPYA